MRHWGAVLPLLLLGTAGAATQAAAQPVHVLGCIKPGVEIGCLIITDKKTGKSYEIGSAVPRPDPGQNLVVDLEGEVFHGMSYCQQGTILKNITWNYTRMLCKAGK